MPIKHTFYLIVGVLLLVFGFFVMFKGFASALSVFKNVFGVSSLSKGSALYIKTDGEPNGEVLAFYLTDSKTIDVDNQERGLGIFFHSYFMISDYPNDMCTVLVVDDNSANACTTNKCADRAGVFYVPIGTFIRSNCINTNLQSCIGDNNICDFREATTGSTCPDKSSSCNLVNDENQIKSEKCSCEGCYVDCNYKPEGYNSLNPSWGTQQIELYRQFKSGSGGVNFCDVSKVLNEKFGSLTLSDDCKNNKNNICYLLDTTSSSFAIKYDLICDKDGKWNACTEDKVGKDHALGNQNCNCLCNGGECEWSGCTPSDFSGTLNINPNPAPAGGTINIEITGQTTAGRVMYMLWVLNPDETVEKCYCGTSNTPQCSNPGVYSCSNTFKITAMSGTFQAMVYDSKPDGSNILAVATTPPAIDVTVQ